MAKASHMTELKVMKYENTVPLVGAAAKLHAKVCQLGRSEILGPIIHLPLNVNWESDYKAWGRKCHGQLSSNSANP